MSKCFRCEKRRSQPLHYLCKQCYNDDDGEPKSAGEEIIRLKRELAEARELLRQCLKVMPCGYIPTHTIENLPKMISDLATELAEETAHHETLEGMYHNVVSACLRCDPIPACEREDNELEPPWEVIDRVRSQRDKLMEALSIVVNVARRNLDKPHLTIERVFTQALAAMKGAKS
jgi:hypothetical protein